MGDSDNKKRHNLNSSEKYYDKESNEINEEFIREDEKLKVANEIYKSLNQLFDKKLGDYISNKELLDNHSKSIFMLTLAVLTLYAIVGYIILFVLKIQ